MAGKGGASARGGRIARQASGLIRLPKGRSDRDVLVDALLEKYGR
jgi:hypothetical protein